MRSLPASRAVLVLSFFAAAAAAQDRVRDGSREPESKVSYDRDVRPILSDRCFTCHGPDEQKRKAELRLDRAEEAVLAREHGAAIVAGDPDRSEVWRRVTTDDVDDAMPPKDSGRPALSARERATLRAWIEQGAVYEEHWSFVPPVRPAVPPTATHPVDAFVRAALAERSLEPSQPAAPELQLRRLFLTLTGLPPEPTDVAAFAADPSDAAYDRWVDRLLHEEPWQSRYAERMAVPWLDGARYADTSGIHMDAGRQIWPFRDWVLRAFRDNAPFDQFVVEQLCGDLIEGATQDQKVATGFHRCHVTTDEGGAIDEEYLVEYAVDRVATTGAVFLGLTLGCARCHEHKFDPISQEEFFGLYAYFRSIDEPGLYSQVPNNNRALEPFLRVPSPEQQREEDRLKQDLAAAEADLQVVPPEEAAAYAEWQANLARDTGLVWAASTPVAATSSSGATMTIGDDASVTASGANPPRDVHEIRLRTEAKDLRLVSLLALPNPEREDQRVGRGENGNAVLQSISVEAVSLRDPAVRQPVPLVWAWASLEQKNGDFRVVNVLDANNGVGWAVDAHGSAGGPRAALFLADAPFGFDGGTELVVTLRYDSVYSEHVFAKVRLDVGAIGDAGLDRLPEASSGFFVAGPFAGGPTAEARDSLWDAVHGPEQERALDRGATFAVAAKKKPAGWRFEERFREGAVGPLSDGTHVTYVGRALHAPSARTRAISLGSDDGFALYLDGQKVAENRTDRAAAPDQDRAELALEKGTHLLVMKVVNTGGNGGFYQRSLPRELELEGDLMAAVLPEAARASFGDRLRTAWRLRFDSGYRAKLERKTAVEQALAGLDARIPRTMVMKERAQRRKTYVLARGQYDQPMMDREIPRSVPKALGSLPPGAPDDRRGLAQWLVAESNPLFARVQVNRLFELAFGAGLVRTSEDFGMQGEYPSHKDLLDWLAVEFRARAFDTKAMWKLLVTSATFRQDDRGSPRAREIDADNRLLSHFPRRRLSAEALRDQALYAAGLLKERFGGPSVKPYQPEGLWQEVAMLQSNTRVFTRSEGDDLFRRSLYTYYKRACPPPSMLTFDAPTRESCVVRRPQTNTPMQALVLWNDEQFVEAARVLALRTMREQPDDASRVKAIFARCTSRTPTAAQTSRLLGELARARERFAAAPADASALLAVGTMPTPPDANHGELAALTLVASAVLNLDATVCLP